LLIETYKGPGKTLGTLHLKVVVRGTGREGSGYPLGSRAGLMENKMGINN